VLMSIHLFTSVCSDAVASKTRRATRETDR
jgi:hypothetical protein